jgi:hypothetical protein
MNGTSCPVFVGGSGRSGTTILGRLFRAHPDVHYFGEPGFFVETNGVNDYLNGSGTRDAFREAMVSRVYGRMNRKLAAHGYAASRERYSPQVIGELVESVFGRGLSKEQEMRAFVKEFLQLGCDAERRFHWVEKTPLSIIMVDSLYLLFPNLHYFHMIREPERVCASFLQQSWGENTVEAAAAHYCDVMKRGMRARRVVPPGQYHVFSLQSLASQPEQVLRYIFSVCGMAGDTETIRKCASFINADRARSRRGVETLSETDVAQIKKVCGPIYRKWVAIEKQTLKRVSKCVAKKGGG